MSRYLKYFPNDAVPVTDSDEGFLGMNSKIDRALLKPTMAAALVNKRLLRGVAETRPGMVTPPALNSVTEPVYGADIYSDPNGTEWLLLAAGSGVWRCRWDRLPEWIAYFDGERVAGPCEMVQCFDKVLLFRGADKTPLEWDGTQTGMFRRIDQTTGLEGAGINPIPNSTTGELVANRLLVPTGRDEVAVSDILDYTRYDAIMSQFRINSGTDERLVRLFAYAGSVLAFKSESVWMLSNLVGTWSDNARLDVLNPQIGCAAEKSVATVGADVFFLSRTGVYRVLQVIQGRIQTAPVPVSDPIEPLIGRINWACADRAVAAVWGQYYLVAVPLDGATSNNVILRYNTVSDNWEGYDQPAFPWSVSRLLITDYLGRKRLMAVDFGGDGTDGTDGTNGTNPRVFVLDEGRDDIAGGVPHPIADLLETRGYTLGRSVEEKQFRDVSVAVATWNPRYTLEAITDGVNEAVTLAGYVTKSRTEYYHFGMPEYDASNANGDQGDYGRKDYSVVPNGVHLGEGIRLDLTQEWIEPQTLRATGRWVAFRITNNQGSCNVRAVRVAGAEMQTTKSTA